MTKLATTPEEFFDITAPMFQNTEFHHLPLIFASLFEPNGGALIIAKGVTRNIIKNKVQDLRQYVDRSMGYIGYEPNYDFMSNHPNKSYLRFEGAGFKGGYKRIMTMRNLKDILLYGFVPGKDDWEQIYLGAQKRTAQTGGRILIHYA